ncbi:MAG: hypothetical protein F9K32_07100 [Desulfobulbaceae bacterium]|nr:MAG: hypothetical protein F9K32_07100 [Desulfobulbaceae bacterium]
MSSEEQNATHNICPNCGFESENLEFCKACGKWIEEPLLARSISVTSFIGGIGSWFREAVLHPDKDITEITEINPATGLPMIGRFGGVKGVDIKGNPYGTGDD